MNPTLTYLPATPEDHKLLTETAIASKQTWGYSDELINLWKSDLEVSEEYILKNKVIKIFNHKNFIGFYGIKNLENGNVEIDHLWLTPDRIRKGYGRFIFQHILNELKLSGHKKVTLIADPNAKGFYDKMGGKVTGQFQSKISGRFLDIYEYEIPE